MLREIWHNFELHGLDLAPIQTLYPAKRGAAQNLFIAEAQRPGEKRFQNSAPPRLGGSSSFRGDFSHCVNVGHFSLSSTLIRHSRCRCSPRRRRNGFRAFEKFCDWICRTVCRKTRNVAARFLLLGEKARMRAVKTPLFPGRF